MVLGGKRVIRVRLLSLPVYANLTQILSAAVSIKMNILLYLPALLMLLVLSRGLAKTIAHAVVISLTVVAVSLPFLLVHPQQYLQYAFEFSRAFLYKWTVNWRFLPQEVFESSSFASGLLAIHFNALCLFGIGKWTDLDGGVIAVLGRAFAQPWRPAGLRPVTADRMFQLFHSSLGCLPRTYLFKASLQRCSHAT